MGTPNNRESRAFERMSDKRLPVRRSVSVVIPALVVVLAAVVTLTWRVVGRQIGFSRGTASNEMGSDSEQESRNSARPCFRAGTCTHWEAALPSRASTERTPDADLEGSTFVEGDPPDSAVGEHGESIDEAPGPAPAHQSLSRQTDFVLSPIRHTGPTAAPWSKQAAHALAGLEDSIRGNSISGRVTFSAIECYVGGCIVEVRYADMTVFQSANDKFMRDPKSPF